MKIFYFAISNILMFLITFIKESMGINKSYKEIELEDYVRNYYIHSILRELEIFTKNQFLCFLIIHYMLLYQIMV